MGSAENANNAPSRKGENKGRKKKYCMDIYNLEGEKQKTLEFDCEYTDIIFEKETVIVYNKNEWNIYTIKGRKKFEGIYESNIRKIIPTGKIDKYLIVTDDTLDAVVLK